MNEHFDPACVLISKQERALLSYLALGMTRIEMQQHTGISEFTIKTKMKYLYRKLRAKNGPHAVGIALAYKLISEEALLKAYAVQLNPESKYV